MLGALIGGIYNYEAQMKTNRMRYDLTKQQWARDDNAVQRRAKDLEAAGLSRTLAAGSGAQTTPAISPESPKLDIPDPVAGVMNLIQQSKNIAKTSAETNLLKMQTKKAGVETRRDNRDLKLHERSGHRSQGKSAFGNILQDMEDYWFNLRKRAKKFNKLLPDNSKLYNRSMQRKRR